MKRSTRLIFGVAWGVLAGVVGTMVDAAQAFPDLEIPRLENAPGYETLGVGGEPGPFRLSRIPGDTLVLQFFNPYCPTCQREAPELERAFGALPSRTHLLAVGVGVSGGELTMFRDHFRITYPMAPDPRFDLLTAVGDPGGSPYLVLLTREEGRWVARDEHLGFLSAKALLARIEHLRGQPPPPARHGAEPPSSLQPPLGLTPTEQGKRVQRFLTRVAGRATVVDLVRVGLENNPVYRASTPNGTPLGLYARILSRPPVCDVCHAVHFMLAFDRDGVARGFEPLHVTKYGNEAWSVDDAKRLEVRLVNRPLAGLVFHREVDAVTRATMSSSLIFDAARRTAALLPDLMNLEARR